MRPYCNALAYPGRKIDHPDSERKKNTASHTGIQIQAKIKAVEADARFL